MSSLEAEDIIDRQVLGALTIIDTDINNYIEDGTIISYLYLHSLAQNIESHFLQFEDIESNAWKDLNIYVSSYKRHDRRFILYLCNKLREYIGFYIKILSDEGLQRSLSYNKSYSNSGSSSMIDRGINSETPQNSLLYDSQDPASDTKFDEAIATYASNIDKNKSATSSSSEGESGTTATGVTWEEARKNVLLLFFNELKDFIMSIPERIYAWYSIDTMPFVDLHKEFIDYIKTLESQE